MQILRFDGVSLDYRHAPLLDMVQFQINSKERICLVGRNGTGKTSLLKLLTEEILPDSGSIWKSPKLKIAKLNQILPASTEETVYEVIAGGLAEIGKLLKEYHQLLDEGLDKDDESWLLKLETVQKAIEVQDGWDFEQKIKKMLTKLNLVENTKLKVLSGGCRRRVALGAVLVSEPDLLLLDEPTNHLDIDSILWMEQQLLQFPGTILCISHDRALIDKLATRIVELDRGTLYSIEGNFQAFQLAKLKRLEVEAQRTIELDKKLTKEESWIRQGIKARRTRNEGRVRALMQLRHERDQRRSLMEKPSFELTQSELSGRLVVEAIGVDFVYGRLKIIDNFSVRIFRGDQIGILGPNGCGKSTLLRLLLGQLLPQTGVVKQGTQLKVAYFDQLREQIDLESSVEDNVGHGRTFITLNGKTKHIISYLRDFLFTPDRARVPVHQLSGGECNRLLLARLFSYSTNLLVLDEPTNDLDIETLELLEELLINYTGTLLLVSHDRCFMDNVITQVLAFEGQGKISEYVGSYTDWLSYEKQSRSRLCENSIVGSDRKVTFGRGFKKLSYALQRELESLLKKIEMLEKFIKKLQNEIVESSFYMQSKDVVNKKLSKLKEVEIELENAYKRWEELD